MGSEIKKDDIMESPMSSKIGSKLIKAEELLPWKKERKVVLSSRLKPKSCSKVKVQSLGFLTLALTSRSSRA